MFKIILYVVNLFFLLILAACAYFIVYDEMYIINAFRYASYSIETRMGQYIFLTAIIIYFLILFLAYFSLLFKKKKTVKVKGPNGKIEVSLSTIESITKTFLESKDIIKNVKPNVVTSMTGTIVNASLECYKSDNLNEKLEIMKEDLKTHIKNMVGLYPKKINLKVEKINPELAVESIKTEIIEDNDNFGVN